MKLPWVSREALEQAVARAHEIGNQLRVETARVNNLQAILIQRIGLARDGGTTAVTAQPVRSDPDPDPDIGRVVEDAILQRTSEGSEMYRTLARHAQVLMAQEVDQEEIARQILRGGATQLMDFDDEDLPL